MILPESQKSDGKKIKVLLVDDEIHFVEVLFKRLSKRNMDVTKTFSGTEGIQALRQVDFDVAVLDLKMEDMDGLEVLKIFKKMYPMIEVIILTGHESEQTAQEGLQHGAFAYLTKPCDFDQLFDTIIKAASD
ncbi:MAG: response regulator [Deltaproteobacteria bacterium]|jgi:DNA-binding NtrC family response regulator|nr:response regulator [Deltaproteobacteria bacterium]MBW2467805.1 response regulator [Deltaproteobacteria bacterium]MBW2515764.1 response regulator [Deltaproteobacteria bacterium]